MNIGDFLQLESTFQDGCIIQSASDKECVLCIGIFPGQPLHACLGLEDLLNLEDILATHAINGEIAVKIFEESEVGYFDVILMDVRMPVMDGLSATRAIRAMERADARTVPIIAMTANVFDEDVERSLQAGMNAHLSKPVEPERLYETMVELIRRRKAP